MAVSNVKRPELRINGNTSENFQNFELRFDDYCIQTLEPTIEIEGRQCQMKSCE